MLHRGLFPRFAATATSNIRRLTQMQSWVEAHGFTRRGGDAEGWSLAPVMASRSFMVSYSALPAAPRESLSIPSALFHAPRILRSGEEVSADDADLRRCGQPWLTGTKVDPEQGRPQVTRRRGGLEVVYAGKTESRKGKAES